MWETYQVSQKNKQRIVPYGRWVSNTNTEDLNTQSETIDAKTRTGNKARDSLHPFATLGPSKDFKVKARKMRFGVLETLEGDSVLRRTDLTGLYLECTTLEYEPFTILKPQADGKVELEGVFGKIFDALKEITNFTNHLPTVRDGQWGSVVNGLWTGMVKELSEGTADIGVAPLSSLVELLTVVLCQVASRCSPRGQRLSPSDAFIVGTGMVFGQGSTLRIERTSERGVVLMFLLLQVLLLAFYTSNLVSALTVGPPLPPMKDLEDVYKDSSITIGFTRGSTIANEFNTDNPLYRAILQRLRDEDLVMSPEEGVERALKGGYAYMAWEYFYKMNFGGECGAFLLPPSYFPHQASIALQKDSPLVPILNKVLLDIQSVGLLQKWWMELNVARTDCSALVTAPIELKTVLTPFLLLGCSLLVSLGVLAAEVVAYRNGRPIAV
ncbi:putative glutamate receptor ionotropic, delta-1 [Penaeus vannamei]|uniref:Putative glutamate receptor ionotropic, delta-1 n=1 Tax=Penaeus vannamei TaxID=6689 RepID=A0A3R7MBK3_PENVA|nr:putative glutamate receptor ionotropic, delta-1 [Penaeus vannamei]